MKKVLVLLLIVYLFTGVKSAFADTVTLGIKPTIIQIDTQGPADATAPFTLFNQSDQPITLTLLLRPFSASLSNDGQIAPLGEGQIPGADPLIFQKVQIMDGVNTVSDITLAPQQKKTLNLHVILPKDEPPSDYYFSVIFVSNPIQNDQSSSSSLSGGISLNVLLSVGPKDKTTGHIKEFSTPFFVNGGPIPFNLLVENTSNHFFVPRGNVLIENMFGQLIGKINLQQVNVLSHSQRYIPDESQISSTQIIWPEKVVFGLYRATLTIALSSDGPLFQKSIYFFAFPFEILIGIGLILIILGVVISRVRKRLKR